MNYLTLRGLGTSTSQERKDSLTSATTIIYLKVLKINVSMRRLFRLYRRWRHTRGFGVHSPFAFRLVTEAIHPPRGYAYYAELEPEMNPLQRILYRVDNFMADVTGEHPTDNLKKWMANPALPLMIMSPGQEISDIIEKRMLDEGCGLLINSRRFIIAIARKEMAFVSYEIL